MYRFILPRLRTRIFHFKDCQLQTTSSTRNTMKPTRIFESAMYFSSVFILQSLAMRTESRILLKEDLQQISFDSGAKIAQPEKTATDPPAEPSKQGNGRNRDFTALQRPLLTASSHTIRLVENEDVLKSYDLLIQFLREPEKAAAVKELVYIENKQTRGYGLYVLCGTPEEIVYIGLQDQERTKEEAQLIESFSATIGLDPSTTAALKDALCPNITISNLDREPGFKQRNRYFQAVATLFLALCSNIQTFRFSFWLDGHQDGQLLENFLIRNNHGELPKLYLQNLQHIVFIHDFKNLGTMKMAHERLHLADSLRLFHRLPNIESVYLTGMTMDDEVRTLLPATSNIKKIHMEYCDMESYHLAALIRSSRALEEVRISNAGKNTYKGGHSLFYPKTIGKALLCHKNTLKILDLDFEESHSDANEFDTWPIEKEDVPEEEGVDYTPFIDEYSHFDSEVAAKPLLTHELPDDRNYGVTIGSLHDFTALTGLSIGVKMLLGDSHQPPHRLIQALPPGLEKLTLRGYRKGYSKRHDVYVAELMERKRDLFPKLSVVRGIDEEISHTTYVDEDEDEDKWWQYWESTAEEFAWIEADE